MAFNKAIAEVAREFVAADIAVLRKNLWIFLIEDKELHFRMQTILRPATDHALQLLLAARSVLVASPDAELAWYTVAQLCNLELWS
jgi:hypothetical protein